MARSELPGKRPFTIPEERKLMLEPAIRYSPIQINFINAVREATKMECDTVSDALNFCQGMSNDQLYTIQGNITFAKYKTLDGGTIIGDRNPETDGEIKMVEAYGSILVGPIKNIKQEWHDMVSRKMIKSKAPDSIGNIHFFPFAQLEPEKGLERYSGALMLLDFIRFARQNQDGGAAGLKEIYAAYSGPELALFLNRTLNIHIGEYNQNHDSQIAEGDQKNLDEWLTNPKKSDPFSLLIFFTGKELMEDIPTLAQKNVEKVMRFMHINDQEEFEKQLRIFELQMSLTKSTPFVYAFNKILKNIMSKIGRPVQKLSNFQLAEKT